MTNVERNRLAGCLSVCVCAQRVCVVASGPHSSPDDNVAELKSLLRRSPDKLRDRDC